jgi:uracil-DNA glycosylase
VASVLRPSKIFLLGEAPGKDEVFFGRPFAGSSGQELERLLLEAGLSLSECSYGNVFSLPPPGNDLAAWAVPRGEYYAATDYPPAGTNGFLSPSIFLPEFERLRAELSLVQPNVIVALGNTALWALTGKSGISKARGAITLATNLAPGVKVLPTFNPAAVLRDSQSRLVVVADLIKARISSATKALQRSRRVIWVAEDPKDLDLFWKLYPPRDAVAVDVETAGKQITVVGFATSPHHILVIPIWNRWSPDIHCWTEPREAQVWDFIAKVCEGPLIKIAQNGVYDMQYLLAHGVRLLNWRRDTMVQMHALYSQLPKDLGFLGATFTDEIAWKSMRPRGTTTEEKKNA